MYYYSPLPQFPKSSVYKLFKHVRFMSLCSILTQILRIKEDAHPIYIYPYIYIYIYRYIYSILSRLYIGNRQTRKLGRLNSVCLIFERQAFAT